MTVTTRIRAEAQGDKTTVRLLVSHAMESGQRKDDAGATVPAWFIQQIEVTCNGRVVMSAYWGTAVSKNPFVQFSFQGGKVGDTIAVRWLDNRGEQRRDEALIA
ncbi:MAG: thiosulfate oxidation carrier complex protein SoxZ [Pseudomonadota bacterium]|nr:thiosulfate oxidation carrier complex protein SoxZ [Pseudomonadota bacterium]